MVARVLGRDISRIRHRRRALALLATLVIAVTAIPTIATFAKVPGGVHCYRKVCHRVKTLTETERLVGQTLTVTASYYDAPEVDRYNVGLLTSSGERFDARNAARAASSIFPDGTELLVWNPPNGRAAHVRVNDFGPFHSNRTLDITRGLAEKLGLIRRGVAELRVTVIAAPPPDEPRYRAFRRYPETKGYLGSYTDAERVLLSDELVKEALSLNPPLPVRAPRLAMSMPHPKPTPNPDRENLPVLEVASLAPPPAAVEATKDAAQEALQPAPAYEVVVAERVVESPIATITLSEEDAFEAPPLSRLRFAAAILSASTPVGATLAHAEGGRPVAQGPATAFSYLLAGAMLSLIALLIAVVSRPLRSPSPVLVVRQTETETPSTSLPLRTRGTTVIGEGIYLEGDVASNGEVVLAGSLKGNCRCRRLHVTATGRLEGDVFADELIVEGKIVGNILARSVRADGQAALAGEVGYVQLAVAREAAVNAVCRLRAVAALMADDELQQAA